LCQFWQHFAISNWKKECKVLPGGREILTMSGEKVYRKKGGGQKWSNLLLSYKKKPRGCRGFLNPWGGAN
jgi:hypothetical protein